MSASASPILTAVIRPEHDADVEAVEALVLAAFGPGRFSKTAERLREAAHRVAGFVAHDEGRLIGSVRLWSIAIDQTPAVFLGPIAVETAWRKSGVGADLVQTCINHAHATGVSGILLIGDPPYFERFGFVQAPAMTIQGPVDPRRLLWLDLTGQSVAGSVVPLKDRNGHLASGTKDEASPYL